MSCISTRQMSWLSTRHMSCVSTVRYAQVLVLLQHTRTMVLARCSNTRTMVLVCCNNTGTMVLVTQEPWFLCVVTTQGPWSSCVVRTPEPWFLCRYTQEMRLSLGQRFAFSRLPEIYNFGYELGARGSPRAHIKSGRSYAHQEDFETPPGPVSACLWLKNIKKHRKSNNL